VILLARADGAGICDAITRATGATEQAGALFTGQISAVLLLLNETMPPLLLTMVALPPLPLSLNCVSPPLFVVMVALAAVLLLLNESTPPLLMMMAAFPAELALLKFRLSLLVKLGANVELLTMPAPLMSKVIPVPLVTKLKTGAPAVNWIVLICCHSCP